MSVPEGDLRPESYVMVWWGEQKGGLESLREINSLAWDIRGASKHRKQYGHVTEAWQKSRMLPAMSIPGRGLPGISTDVDCPLASLCIGVPPVDEVKSERKLRIGSPRELERYRAEFDKRDYDQCGQIETKQLRGLMSSLGTELTEGGARLMMQRLDADGSGNIDFDEFIAGAFDIRVPRPDDPPPKTERQRIFADMCQLINEDDVEGVRSLILKHGASGWADPASGIDLIHFAAQRGCERMVSMVLELGGDVNQTTVLGSTPLHIASKSSHKDRKRTVAALLSAGADARARNANGLTGLHLLKREYLGPGSDWLERPEVVDRFNQYMTDGVFHYGSHTMIGVTDVAKATVRKHKGEDRRHKHRHHRHHHHGEDGHRKHKHRHHHEEEAAEGGKHVHVPSGRNHHHEHHDESDFDKYLAAATRKIRTDTNMDSAVSQVLMDKKLVRSSEDAVEQLELSLEASHHQGAHLEMEWKNKRTGNSQTGRQMQRGMNWVPDKSAADMQVDYELERRVAGHA